MELAQDNKTTSTSRNGLVLDDKGPISTSMVCHCGWYPRKLWVYIVKCAADLYALEFATHSDKQRVIVPIHPCVVYHNASSVGGVRGRREGRTYNFGLHNLIRLVLQWIFTNHFGASLRLRLFSDNLCWFL